MNTLKVTIDSETNHEEAIVLTIRMTRVYGAMFVGGHGFSYTTRGHLTRSEAKIDLESRYPKVSFLRELEYYNEEYRMDVRDFEYQACHNHSENY